MSIFSAIVANKINLVKSLIDKDRSVLDLPYRPIPFKPFYYACYLNKTEIIKLLIDYVDLDEPSSRGLRAIHFACYHNNIEIVKLLINRVNLEVEDINKSRPIHYACKYSDFNIIKLLVDGFIDDRIYSNLPRIQL